ncbi:MAG TPA: FkbM family methyltransferase [Nitrososphaeraceae archaeon]|nr:FkbM family methyltransferase [Nitrososphaeraceae archaeon]
MIELPLSKYNGDYIGSNSWLLKEGHGAKIFDRFVLFSLRLIYLGVRVLLRIILGKERRDRVYKEKDISFKDFLYRSLKLLGIDKSIMLKFDVPTYGYKVYCPINKEDFAIMSRHEDEIIDHFNTKQGDIVVDVGAHMGKYTIIASKRVGANGKVIAIEAHPGNYEMLNRNIKLNGLTNVTTLNYAVYSKESKIKLFLPDEESGYTMHHSVMFNYLSSKYPLQGKDNEKFIEVNANTLDNLLQKNGILQVNWIKIDVEGAEFEVLKGSANILSISKDISLLIEVHNPSDIDHYKQIIDFLKPYNFKIEFEKIYRSGERHMVARKISS